jgi:hypothetical protein
MCTPAGTRRSRHGQVLVDLGGADAYSGAGGRRCVAAEFAWRGAYRHAAVSKCHALSVWRSKMSERAE